MTSNLPERDDADFLSGALHGAADAMPGGETEEMHLQFGVVRDRVHRRRATKIGGIGATALAVVGGLAVGAAQLSPFDDEALLPADPTPSDTVTVEPGPTQDTILDGYLPSDIYEGTPLACGAGEDVVPRSADGYAIEIEGLYVDRAGGEEIPWLDLTVEGESADFPGHLEFPPGTVWVRDGQIARLPSYFDPEPHQVAFDEAGVGRTEDYLSTGNTCLPPEGFEDIPSSRPVPYEQPLPAGAYTVYPILWTDVTAGSADYVAGEPVVVEVLPGGSVAGLDEAPFGDAQDTSPDGPGNEPSGDPGSSGDGNGPGAGTGSDGAGGSGEAEAGDAPGDCSAAGLDDTSDFSFEPEPVARTARALVDAALACDVDALELVEEPGVTQLHRAAEVSVAERFALPEGEDDVYAKLVALLSGTAVVDPGTGNHVWPTVASPEYQDDPVAWDYAVEMGFATRAQADAWRAAGGAYHGWRMSIEPDGTWRTFLGTDPAAG